MRLEFLLMFLLLQTDLNIYSRVTQIKLCQCQYTCPSFLCVHLCAEMDSQTLQVVTGCMWKPNYGKELSLKNILSIANSFWTLPQVSSIKLGLPCLRKISSSEEYFCTLMCTLTQQGLQKKLCSCQTHNHCQKLTFSSRFQSESMQQDAWKCVELPTLTSAKVPSDALKILPRLLIIRTKDICSCKSQD